MPVPLPIQFDGTNLCRVLFNLGAVSIGSGFTMVAIIRRKNGGGDYQQILGVEDTGDANVISMEVAYGNWIGIIDSAEQGNFGALTADKWYLVAYSKPSGTSAPRGHSRNITDSGAWSHGNASSTAHSARVPAKITLGEWSNLDPAFLHLAVVGIWNSVLTDGQIETLDDNLDAWAALNPSWWSIANGTTPMIDQTGGTGDETDRQSGVTASQETSPLQWSSYVSQVMADSPVAYYRMDEASGQPQDASGNGNHTTVTNGTPVYSQPGALGSDPPSTSIYQDGAVSFVGFTAPDHASLDVGDVFSVECWMKRTRSGAFEEAWLTKGVNSFFCSIKNDRLHLAQQDVASIAESTVTITDTAWHYLAITKNGSTVKLYVDGVDVTGTVTNQTLTNTTAVLATGHGTYPIDAYIDEVAVYPTALSVERIRAHYRAGKYYRPSTNVGVRM